MEIETVRTRRQLKEFIDLPYDIYKDYPLWVPQLKKDEFFLLSADRHPFWLTAERELCICRRNGRAIGRIAAIWDKKYNQYAQEEAGTFGFFECEDDMEAASTLLEHARAWLEERGLTLMRGPFNPSANYSCGMLVSGFELPPVLMMPWNPPYYPVLLENWHMRKEKDTFAYLIDRHDQKLAPWVEGELEKIKSLKKFSCRHSSKKTLSEDVRAMLNIYRESWADNWGFSPLSQQEADALVKELTPILDPEFFALFFYEGEPAAGMVALPDFNPLLKKLNGKIGISAPWHYFKLRKRLQTGYRIMLFGILPQYRRLGLPMLLLEYMLELAKNKPGLEWVEGSWVLEDNPAIDELIEDFGGKLTKRYRIYRRDIGSC